MGKIKESSQRKNSDMLLTVFMCISVFVAVVLVSIFVIMCVRLAGAPGADTAFTDENNSSDPWITSADATTTSESGTVPNSTTPVISTDVLTNTHSSESSTEDTDCVSQELSQSETGSESSEPNYPRYTDKTVKIPKDFIASRYAILVDAKSNTVVAQSYSDERIYPASMTKIMTVIVACETVKDFEVKYTMKAEQIRKAANQGASMAGFWAWDVVSIEDLLYGVILPSGADAAYALADYVAGSEEAYVALMNKKAREIGMTSTNFTNVTGLHSDDHYSTARDIVVMMEYAMSIPTVKKVMSAVTYTTTHGKTLVSVVFNKTEYKHKKYSNGVVMIAGKSGYTPEAGYCLATYYEDSAGNSYILVTADSPISKKSIQPVNDAKTIIEGYIK